MVHIPALPKSITQLSLVVTAIAGGLLTTPLFKSIDHPHHMQAVHSRSIPSETIEGVDRTTVLLTAFAGSAAIGMGLSAFVNRKRSVPLRRHGSRLQQDISLGRADYRLQRRLLLLMHDDVRAANRLLLQASFKYPGESVNWYAEKVIYDLERDRGGR